MFQIKKIGKYEESILELSRLCAFINLVASCVFVREQQARQTFVIF